MTTCTSSFLLNQRFLIVKKMIASLMPKRTLDVGCGDGSFSQVIQKFSEEVYGVDISVDAVLLAQKRGIHALTVDLNNSKLPFEDNFFDLVYAGEIIEHLYDCESFIKECARVLKKDGHLIITTPNLASWYNRFLLLMGYRPFFADVGRCPLGKFPVKFATIQEIPHELHLHMFTLRALKELLENEGLYVIKSYGARTDARLPRWLTLIEAVMSHKAFLASHLIVLARKA